MYKFRSLRTIKRLPVSFSSGNVQYRGTSSDFSYTGLFIRTRKPFGPGTSVKMVIEIDENRNVPLTGVVVRANKTRIVDVKIKNGMGLKIDSMTQDYKNFLIDLFRARI